jgi:hypothetical protein
MLYVFIAWKALFQDTWKTFKSKSEPIMSDLRTTRNLLNEEKITSLMIEFQKFGEMP